jgi:hypothetical protein
VAVTLLATDSRGICLSTTGDCPSTSGDCPWTTDDCPSTTDDCPWTSGDCPSTTGDCPSTTGDCRSTTGDCPWTSGDCPSTTDDCPSTMDECQCTPRSRCVTRGRVTPQRAGGRASGPGSIPGARYRATDHGPGRGSAICRSSDMESRSPGRQPCRLGDSQFGRAAASAVVLDPPGRGASVGSRSQPLTQPADFVLYR